VRATTRPLSRDRITFAGFSDVMDSIQVSKDCRRPLSPPGPVIEGLERRVLFAVTAPAAPAATGGWATGAPAPLPLFEAEAASAGGSVYVFAGFDNQKIQVTEQVESYDAASGVWRTLGQHSPAPETHVGTATDGRVVYFAGGFRGNWVGQPSSDVWEFDTSTMTWSRGPSLPAQRAAGGLVLVGRQLHFFGGLQADGRTDSADHWVLDLDHPDAGWIAKAPLPHPRNHLGYAALDGKIYAIGGQHRLDEQNGQDAAVNVYDPANDRWSNAAPLPVRRSHLHNSTVVYGGKLLCVGGSDVGAIASDQVLQYDPAADRWTLVGRLPAPRSAAVAQVVGDQLVVTTGTPTGVSPQTSTWTHPLPFTEPVTAVAAQITLPPPSAALAGGRGTTTIRVTNDGTEPISGPADVALYLSGSPMLDPGAAVPLATVRRRLQLPAGHSRTVRVGFRYPSAAAASAAGTGSYYLVAQVSPAAPAGSSTTWSTVPSAGTTPLRLSAPLVNLSGSFDGPALTALPAGRRAVVSLVVRNAGNVPAAGPLGISLSASADRSPGGTTLLNLKRHVHIPPNGKVTIHLRFARPATLAPGTYYLAATIDGTKTSPAPSPTGTAFFSDTPFEVT
jgi:N-acetylneuraminic acid mutarotase